MNTPDVIDNNQEMNSPIITLSRSIVFDGETVTELNLNLDELTSEDLLAAERQMNAMNKGMLQPVPELSKLFQALVAARAAKVPGELITQLSAKDFSKITLRVQNFLLG